MSEINNLEFWDSVEMTNPDDTKKVDGSGHKVTSIDAYTQFKNATSKWGMMGKTWGLRNIRREFMNMDQGQVLCVIDAEFYFPDGVINTGGSILAQVWYNRAGYMSVDADFYKKALTNLMTKALSMLGFNADIFMGKFEDNEYMAKVSAEFAPEPVKADYNKGTAWKAIKGGCTLAQFSESVNMEDQTNVDEFNKLVEAHTDQQAES